MNCEVCQLKELEVEHFEIREVLRYSCYMSVGNDIVLIMKVQCGDVELEKKIDEKIEQFISWVEKRPNKKSQVCISFYEVKNKHPSWFTNKTERLYWEQWYINLNVSHQPKAHLGKSHHSKIVVDPGETSLDERSARRAALESSLREVLFQIIKFVNEKKDHVPPISDGVSCFPYEITIPSSSDSAFGMDMIKRMLHTGCASNFHIPRSNKLSNMLTKLNRLYHHPFLHFFPKNLIFTLTQMKKQHLVLVHGTNHGAWCWYKLITRLKSAGHRVTALDLGGSGVNFGQVFSIDDYVKPLVQFMAHLPEEERVILVGHSYGGIPISLAMEKFPSKILVAVFVAAFMPSISSPPANVVLELSRRMSMESLMDSKFDWTNEANDGRNLVMFGPHHMRTSIYQNCQPEVFP
ncbi:Autophagy-related protein 101 [Linum perenne]